MFGPILVQRWHTIFCSLTCSCRSTKHNKQRRSCSCLEVAVLFCKCAHVVGLYLERKLRIWIMTLSSDSSLVLLHPNILSFYICLYIFHEKFTFSTRMQKHMQPQNAMHTCALKDTLRKSWCKTLTLDEIPLSAFNGFSVRWCHIPSSAFKVCLLRVPPPPSFSASLQFCCHFLGVCVSMGMWVLCSQQRAGNKSRHCAPYRTGQRGFDPQAQQLPISVFFFFFFFFFRPFDSLCLSLLPGQFQRTGRQVLRLQNKSSSYRHQMKEARPPQQRFFFFFF